MMKKALSLPKYLLKEDVTVKEVQHLVLMTKRGVIPVPVTQAPTQEEHHVACATSTFSDPLINLAVPPFAHATHQVHSMLLTCVTSLLVFAFAKVMWKVKVVTSASHLLMVFLSPTQKDVVTVHVTRQVLYHAETQQESAYVGTTQCQISVIDAQTTVTVLLMGVHYVIVWRAVLKDKERIAQTQASVIARKTSWDLSVTSANLDFMTSAPPTSLVAGPAPVILWDQRAQTVTWSLDNVLVEGTFLTIFTVPQ